MFALCKNIHRPSNYEIVARRGRDARPIRRRRVESVRRRIRKGVVASGQSLQLGDLSWLNEIRIKTCGEARLAEVRVRIASEGDKVKLRPGKPLRRRRPSSNPFIPGIEISTMAHSG